MIAPALPSEPPPPSVRRRLAALAYESLLLFGVVFFAGLTFGVALQQRNGLDHRNLLAGWIALVVGAYFVWFWTHGGQTLPMKTWRLRVETARGAPLSAGRALARYALGWLWFLPPLALHPLAGFPLPRTLAATAVWFALWALAARLHPSRQFPHDRLAGTRIVDTPRRG
ncbi:RDD family protein [Burkholderia pseudomallei]|uniref:RDD family protein n=1 Tax=Burkholderia pseudomallei TaxID=28450 RepID=A0AA40JEA6_BURPE|nr:RDD family protein [Burkholderia pseudomallei]AHE28246.1 RDD family protein [Burkholderia pseudomallei NCTC 13178]AHE35183.1 RDD family protein [Burkholderia pseudomallei NAU20B-16]AHG36147.1 RDD family protein [Burkholderia pseudomallei MSHR511]AHG68507.1 RDD family protein [Burkholderia pseudomallei MSHR146]AIP02670.1 RDD family protein [Burkholderia pseudomallei]